MIYTLCFILYTLYFILYALYFMLYTSYFMLYTLCFILYTLYFILYTLNIFRNFVIGLSGVFTGSRITALGLVARKIKEQNIFSYYWIQDAIDAVEAEKSYQLLKVKQMKILINDDNFILFIWYDYLFFYIGYLILSYLIISIFM